MPVLSIALSTKAQEGHPAPGQGYVALPPVSPTLEASRSVTCFMVRGLYPLCRSWITGSNSSANTWKDTGRHAALQIQSPTEPLPPARGLHMAAQGTTEGGWGHLTSCSTNGNPQGRHCPDK